MRAPSPLWFALTVLGVGACSDPPAAPVDASMRFDARDAVIEPRDVVSPRDVAYDLPTFVDAVMLVDLGAPPSDTGAPVTDAPRLDAGAAADGGQCTELAEAYAQAVRSAQRCMGETQCSTLACETLCCACEVYVDPMAEGFGALDRLRRMAQTQGCAEVLPCPGQACPAAAGAVCSGDGRCVTLRGSGGDGG